LAKSNDWFEAEATEDGVHVGHHSYSIVSGNRNMLNSQRKCFLQTVKFRGVVRQTSSLLIPRGNLRDPTSGGFDRYRQRLVDFLNSAGMSKARFAGRKYRQCV
jgi:hypothetical protein